MKNFLIFCCAVLYLFTYINCANVYRKESLRALKLIIDKALIDNDLRRNFEGLSHSFNGSNNVEYQSIKRSKRSVMRHGKCALGYAWYAVKCWPCNEYKEISGKSCDS